MQNTNQIPTNAPKVNRDPLLDIIKGVAIILVLIGHTIQDASGRSYLESGLFYEHWLFKFIYGFHMPLFMIVSGYLFYNTVQNKKWNVIVVDKLRTLILPIFSFALIVYIFNFHSEYNIIDQVKNYLSRTRFTLWFLWALFYSSMGILIVKHLFKDNIFVYILLILGSFCTPDKWFSELYKFMFPCFLAGYYGRKYNWMQLMQDNKGKVVIISGLVYIFLLFFYSTECYVYMSGCNLFNPNFSIIQLGINCFRIVVGVIGSIFIISLIKWIYDRITFCKSGIIFNLLDLIRWESIVSRTIFGCCILNGI